MEERASLVLATTKIKFPGINLRNEELQEEDFKVTEGQKEDLDK